MTIYKTIEGHPGYWVGDNGTVWTIWCRHSGNSKRAQNIVRQLTGNPDKDGYLQVKIDRKNKKIHRLVLEAFVGPCPQGEESRHLNGCHSDNALSNLCWGTKLDNWNDKIIHGRDNVGHCHGETNGRAKLTAEQALTIKNLYLSGVRPSKIAKQFGVNRNHVRHIALGLKWQNLPK